MHVEGQDSLVCSSGPSNLSWNNVIKLCKEIKLMLLVFYTQMIQLKIDVL